MPAKVACSGCGGLLDEAKAWSSKVDPLWPAKPWCSECAPLGATPPPTPKLKAAKKKVPMMQKRHYEFIAECLREVRNVDWVDPAAAAVAVDHVAYLMGSKLANTNKGFKFSEFLAAAGYELP